MVNSNAGGIGVPVSIWSRNHVYVEEPGAGSISTCELEEFLASRGSDFWRSWTDSEKESGGNRIGLGKGVFVIFAGPHHVTMSPCKTVDLSIPGRNPDQLLLTQCTLFGVNVADGFLMIVPGVAQNRFNILDPDRLGDKIIHTGSYALLPRFE